MRDRLRLEERFGWTYVEHVERDTTDGLVEVTLRDPAGTTSTLLTRRLIKAFGHGVRPQTPLATSSTRVHSVTPETLEVEALRAEETPVWIVGGGKTAMDTAYRVITALPGREVHLLAGPGTLFSRRDTFFPTGLRRWWSGTLTNTMVRQVADHFDGANDADLRSWYRSTYGITPVPGAVDFFGAYLSEAESTVIARGLQSIERAYFADAVDAVDAVDAPDGQVAIVDRDGVTRPTPAGSWIINCTGSLLRHDEVYEPYASPSGRVLSIQMRSSTFGGFSTFAGYYMTHLMFQDRLADVPLYELDLVELQRQAAPLVMWASMTLAMHNLSLAIDVLPKRALLDCGIDYNLWYPLPRQAVGLARILATHRRKRVHDQRTLDTLGSRFGIRSGPLPSVAARH